MHISVETLHGILSTWGYLAVFLFVAIESTGIPFPGETMLIVASAYAGTGHLKIVGVIVAASVGAIIGDNLGYVVGRTGGREVALRFGHRVGLNESKLDLTGRFFQLHGDKTVFLGRFIAVLRAWAAFLAGVNRMPWPKFLLFNAAGGITWAILYGFLSYKLGESVLEKLSGRVAIGALVLVILAVVVLVILHRRGVTVERLLLRGTDSPRRDKNDGAKPPLESG